MGLNLGQHQNVARVPYMHLLRSHMPKSSIFLLDGKLIFVRDGLDQKPGNFRLKMEVILGAICSGKSEGLETN